jgi:hypothetical protein
MSSIQVAKATMQYVGIAPNPNQQCRDCFYGTSTHESFAGRCHCGKGGFFVAAVASCKEFTAKIKETK